VRKASHIFYCESHNLSDRAISAIFKPLGTKESMKILLIIFTISDRFLNQSGSDTDLQQIGKMPQEIM